MRFLIILLALIALSPVAVAQADTEDEPLPFGCYENFCVWEMTAEEEAEPVEESTEAEIKAMELETENETTSTTGTPVAVPAAVVPQQHIGHAYRAHHIRKHRRRHHHTQRKR